VKLPPPDGSRDPRIDDPTNIWFVHVAGRALLPIALKLHIPANAVSVVGLLLGATAAAALYRWERLATAAFLLLVLWMIADGLDGMIARATATASALGRFLDGLCDHAVFVLVYVALAASLDTTEGWALAVCAGAAHAVQATLYEGERMRFHRRLRGEAPPPATTVSANPLVRAYDAVAGSLDRIAAPFDRRLATAEDGRALALRYAAAAIPALKLMIPLSNNMRVLLIWLACLALDPRLFWWIELGPLTAIAAAGILWHRRVERRLVSEG
jgi:hypothetical protein